MEDQSDRQQYQLLPAHGPLLQHNDEVELAGEALVFFSLILIVKKILNLSVKSS